MQHPGWDQGDHEQNRDHAEPVLKRQGIGVKSHRPAENEHGAGKLLDVLEDNDDVQNVYANFDIPDAVMQRLSA